VVDLPVTAIRRNPRQPRRAIEAEALNELAQSIAEVGIVQPVIVRPVDEGYELIAGERRWRAAQKAGFTVVPAIIRAASDVESLELALIENVVRQQLNPLDEAFALKVLLEDLGVTQESLAARVGKSRSAIANKVRLLDLPAPIQDALAQGLMSEGHGRALLGLKGQAQQIQFARRITDKGLSVRQVEEEVRRLEEKGKVQPERHLGSTVAHVRVLQQPARLLRLAARLGGDHAGTAAPARRALVGRGLPAVELAAVAGRELLEAVAEAGHVVAVDAQVAGGADRPVGLLALGLEADDLVGELGQLLLGRGGRPLGREQQLDADLARL
jgi:ParB family chromosome partitioning protein